VHYYFVIAGNVHCEASHALVHAVKAQNGKSSPVLEHCQCKYEPRGNRWMEHGGNNKTFKASKRRNDDRKQTGALL